jgi:signal transduction histidine kinase
MPPTDVPQRPAPAWLARTALFSALPAEALDELAGLFTRRRHDDGEAFIHQGERENRMYLVAEGRVRIHHGEETVAELGPGDVVGEMALLDEGPRTMSASALGPVTLYFMDREGFHAFLHRFPQLTLPILATVMGRYRDLDRRYVRQLEDREKELERTVQKRTRELEERNAELRRVQAFKEQFLANMSHEIRTPLNAIVGMGNLMAHSALDESQAAYLTYIREAARNLRVIVDEILDFSKLEAGRMELESVPFDPRATVDLVHQMLRFKTEEKGLYFRVEVADDVPAVLVGDPTRLGQVLINLCGNAIKFTERGGVTVRFARTGEHGDPVRLRLSVRDTGIGIRPEHLEKIFEQFAQATTGTTRQFGGTGLGLSIARRIARLMGGDLTVESAFGEGTSFHADLVLAEGRPEDLAPETGPAAEVRDLGALRILLVEDNAFNVLVATGTLEMELPEATVDVAENGVRALERLDAERYDLVLMDIQMPEMDGYEATRRIREHADRAVRDLPVIAMTANVIKSERDRCLAVGMNACVAKPFEVEDLMDAIRAHVG